jgi:hypothetical protein
MFKAIRIRVVLAVVALCALTAGSIFAEGVKKKIRFARGATSTTISGAVIRGDSDRYYVGAKAGQTMKVNISSLEKNAVFHVYLPDEQQTLPKAGEQDETTKWSGTLPSAGQYVIVVGGTRGNATYKLTVSVR